MKTKMGVSIFAMSTLLAFSVSQAFSVKESTSPSTSKKVMVHKVKVHKSMEKKTQPALTSTTTNRPPS